MLESNSMLNIHNMPEYVWIYDNRILSMSSQAVVRRCSLKKVFLEISQNSKENTSARVSFFIKLHGLACNLFIKKEILEQVFSREFCKISKNTFFTEHLRWLFCVLQNT